MRCLGPGSQYPCGNGYLRNNKNLVILVRTLNAKSPGKTKSLAHFSNLNHSLQLMFSSSENMSSTSATITMSSVNSVKDVRLHQMNLSYTLTFLKITVVVTQEKYKVSILERHITKQLCKLAFCMWTRIQSYSVQSPTVDVMTQLQYGHIFHQYLNTFGTITRKSYRSFRIGRSYHTVQTK